LHRTRADPCEVLEKYVPVERTGGSRCDHAATRRDRQHRRSNDVEAVDLTSISAVGSMARAPTCPGPPS